MECMWPMSVCRMLRADGMSVEYFVDVVEWVEGGAGGGGGQKWEGPAVGGGNWYVRVLVVTTGIGWVVMVDEVVTTGVG